MTNAALDVTLDVSNAWSASHIPLVIPKEIDTLSKWSVSKTFVKQGRFVASLKDWSIT